MSVFRCKMCGGSVEFQPGETTGVCDSCGTRQTLPRLDDERKRNLYDRADHYRSGRTERTICMEKRSASGSLPEAGETVSEEVLLLNGSEAEKDLTPDEKWVCVSTEYAEI